MSGQPHLSRVVRSVLLASLCIAVAAVASGIGLGGDPVTAGGQTGAELQRLRNRGKALYEEKEFANAARVLGEVVESPEATAQDWLNLALAHLESNEEGPALEAASRALEIDSASTGAHYVVGLVHKRRTEYGSARRALDRAKELDPTAPSIRYNLGATLVSLGEEEAALREFEAVIDMGFDLALQFYVSSIYRHFQLLLGQGKREEARAEIERYNEVRSRLSQAAQAPAALQRGRYSVVRVPNRSLVPANPASAAEVAYAAGGVIGEGGGTVAVGDLTGDGRPELVVTGRDGGVWEWTAQGYRRHPLSTPPGPAAIGDYDRDGRPDLYVADPDGDALYRNLLGDEADGGGASPGDPAGASSEEAGDASPEEGGDAGSVDGEILRRVDAAGLPAGGAPTAVLWVDYDHDGDLDVLVTHGRDAAGTPVADRLLRNRGGGTFEAVGEEAGIAAGAPSTGATWADFDGDNDVDLYVLREGEANALYTNERQGRFAEIAGAVGAAGPVGTADAVAADLDNDGHLDLVLAGADGLTALRNTGDGTFLPATGEIEQPAAARAVAAGDLNNDGYLDLAVATDAGLDLLINGGEWRFGGPSPRLPEPATAVEMARLRAVDADADGAVDLVASGAGAASWLMQEGPTGSWTKVTVEGIKNNIRGIGSTVEVKGDGFYQLRPLRRAPLHFGVGELAAADVIRITWPNGIVQNLMDEATGRLLATRELERLEGSCPFLYAWNGDGWEFVNEVLGVAPLGMPLGDGEFHAPDPDEYVPVPGEALAPRDGYLELRFTEELREVGYLDAIRLLAVDHPRGSRLVPDERFTAPPHPEFRLFWLDESATRPVRAVDQRGRDWTAALRRVDRRWAEPFEPGRYDGLATPHSLTLELPEAKADEPVRLYLTGWVYWATGSVNLAVGQDPRVAFTPVTLEVPDGDGGWRVAVDDIGLPNAKNSTLSVDLTDRIDPDDPRVRLRTTTRLYWDAAFYTVGAPYAGGLRPGGDWAGRHGVPRTGDLALRPDGTGGDGAASVPVRARVLGPVAGDLRYRGFSRLHRTAEGFETFTYDTVRARAPWNQHPGHYTRYGPVGDLLLAADDRYVILGTGDEVAIRFPDDLPEPPEGWERDYLVYLNGWVKDGDPNTARGDRVEPLPFHGMDRYPYPPGIVYPDTSEMRRFLRTWVTRPARQIQPRLTGGR